MTDIDTIALYGPGQLKPEDLVAGFVARESTLNYFLAELKHQTTSNASPRHHLIIGQRGMGKTTLLHRIAIAIGDDAALAACFVPLTFREEQYNVINLHVFWCNCIDALLDWLEQHEQVEVAKKLEAELIQVETRYEQNRKDEADGNSAKQLLQSACAQLQRRPVLLLDNLDLILEALKKHDWGLRDYLQQSGNALVISAAAAYPKSLSDKKAAFFDFFRITTLQRLELPEIRTCLYQLARRRGEPGQHVTELLNRSPGRIAALTEMTGGNPRTLAILYLLLESQAGEDAFADLEKLLDRMTPLYKARAEEAPPQARAVLDAVALAWDPITATEAAKESGLEIQTVNSQLSRLEKDGFIEKVEVTGSGRHGYQMVERFFNIWYLMRHGSRRLRQRVHWLTAFLRGFYSGGDRENIARNMLRNGNHQGRADMMMALSDCVEDPIVSKALSHAAGRDLLRYSNIRESIANLVDLRDIDPEQADMAELERRILSINRKDFNAPAFWDLLGGSLEMNSAEKRRIITSLPTMADEQLTKLFTTLQKEVSELCAELNISAEQLAAYRAAVRDGSIRHCYDLQGASAAALHENNVAIAAIGCLLALKKDGDLDEVRATCQRFAEETSELWERVVSDPLFGEMETAQRAYKRGNILSDTYKEFNDAVLTIRKAIELDSQNPQQWNSLGAVLHFHLKQYEEAEAAYRKAIELDAKFAWPWNNLGNLLQYGLKRYEEAEAAYRKAIELDATDARSWNSLGKLFQCRLERYEEAEAAYRKAIKLDPNLAYPWINLAYLLGDNLNRYQEAEAACRLAIELEPNDNVLWNSFGILLQYYLCKFQEAEQAYFKALELNAENDNPFPHGNLAFLYWLDLKRPDAAKHHADLAHKGLDECGKQLLEVARLLAEDSMGLAWSAFDSAITLGSDAIWDCYGSCLQYILRYVHHHGYGEKFQSWMEAADYPARYAPLYWAFCALQEGEAILLNVNPEVRRTAEKIYQGLAIGKLSASPAQKPQRRRSTLKRKL